MIKDFATFITESKNSKETDVKDIKKALGIEANDEMCQMYKTGETLAKALLKATGSQVKTSELLVYSLDNAKGEEMNRIKDALTYLKDEVPNKGETIDENDKWSGDVKVKKGKMRKLLNIPEDSDIEDKYYNGESLAKALLNKVDKAKVSHMLSFASNVNKKNDSIFTSALHWIKNNVD